MNDIRTSRRCLAALCALAASALVTAQDIRTRFATASVWRAFARGSNTGQQVTAPFGTDLAGGFVLEAFSTPPPGHESEARTGVTFDNDPRRGITATIVDAARVGKLGTAFTGPQVSIIEFKSDQPVAAMLTFGVSSGKFPNQGQSHSSSVDVGNDGTVDYTFANLDSAQQVSRQVVIDAVGLRVLITTGANAGVGGLLGASITATTTLSLTPQPRCTHTPYGSSCGPVLRSESVFGGALFAASGATPNAPAFLIAGTVRLDFPILATGCRLLTDNPIVLPIQPTDASGSTGLTVRLPNRAFGPVNFQIATFDLLVPLIETTTAIALTCR